MKLIINTYENSSSYRNSSFSKKLVNPVEDVTRLRKDIFHMFDREQGTCPLASTLKLQYERAKIITKYWACIKLTEGSLLENGWKRKDGTVVINLQDENDPLYTIPNRMVKGCTCKKKPCWSCECNPQCRSKKHFVLHVHAKTDTDAVLSHVKSVRVITLRKPSQIVTRWTQVALVMTHLRVMTLKETAPISRTISNMTH